MQVITTRHLGPTVNRSIGDRIVASTTSKLRKFVAYDYDLSQDLNHVRAARLLAEDLGWSGEWVAGTLNEHGNVYVRVLGCMDQAGFRVEEAV